MVISIDQARKTFSLVDLDRLVHDLVQGGFSPDELRNLKRHQVHKMHEAYRSNKSAQETYYRPNDCVSWNNIGDFVLEHDGSPYEVVGPHTVIRVNAHGEMRIFTRVDEKESPITIITQYGRMRAIKFPDRATAQYALKFRYGTVLNVWADGVCEFGSDKESTYALYRRIDELDLPTFIANKLTNCGFEYIWHLVNRTEVEMLKTRGLGKKRIGFIKSILADLGLEFGMVMPKGPYPWNS